MPAREARKSGTILGDPRSLRVVSARQLLRDLPHGRIPGPIESSSAGIEIAHHDAEHLSGQPGLALGDMHAGLIGQIVVGARHGRIRRR